MATFLVPGVSTPKKTSAPRRSPTQQEKSYPPLPSFFTKGSNNKHVLKDNEGHFHDVSLGDILERTIPDDARSSEESIGPSLFTSSLSYKSSFAQTSVSQFSSDLPTKPSSPSIGEYSQQKDLIIPCPRLPDPVARQRDSGSVYSVEDVSVQAVDYTATATQTSPRNSILKENAAPATKIEIDSESQNLDEYLRKYGQRRVTRQKHIMTAFFISVNFMFIFASWWWPRYYYVYIPFISFPLVLNCIMIASIICFTLKNLISAEKILEPDHLEDLIMVMPCYNETLEECTKSLDSLVDQVGIDNHKRGIMVICDGRVRGPGMEKTTAQYLNEDIFVEQLHREKITRAYRAWDGQAMDVEISWGY
ncbi:hypothetical protein FANTH_173 [Fusarium anthophilum]|uniref:Chitin synthase n=1 Tax=Fusarium anthophilum TaxID=48485 RepID=A0A8H4ZYC8_9HYPO|nr:hypothetical protein FANTH_173 [Fusarium anthophilum]